MRYTNPGPFSAIHIVSSFKTVVKLSNGSVKCFQLEHMTEQ